MALSAERVKELLSLAMEDVALVYAGHVRGIHESVEARRSLSELHRYLGLGEPPEFEPEIRVRRVS